MLLTALWPENTHGASHTVYYSVDLFYKDSYTHKNEKKNLLNLRNQSLFLVKPCFQEYIMNQGTDENEIHCIPARYQGIKMTDR